MPQCYICKRNIPKGESYVDYHMADSGKLYRRNYCSQEELESWRKEEEYRVSIMETLVDYMGYDINQILPNIVVKEISTLHKSYTYRIIYNVIRHMEEGIRFSMKKDFKSDFVRGKYLAAMLSNNINDEYEKLKRETKIERDRAKQQHVEIEEIDVAMPIKRKQVRDISDFLD